MRILFNGHIQTLDDRQPVVSALAIEGDKIVAAGSDAEILALANRQDVVQDLKGKTVWPGLTDAHIHLENYALSLTFVDCETETRAECLRRVAPRPRRHRRANGSAGMAGTRTSGRRALAAPPTWMRSRRTTRST